MRYDTPVYFQTTKEGAYNEDTGDYDEPTTEETRKWASVTNTTENMQQMVYGQLRQGSITMHIQNRYKGAFSTIRIGDKIYAVDYKKRLRTKEVFVLSEVMK